MPLSLRGRNIHKHLINKALRHFSEKGYMSAGLKLVLEKVFKELALHRLEANIQPENNDS